MKPLIDYKKTYTLAYIHNRNTKTMILVPFTANEIHKAYNSLPLHRDYVCERHDLRSRLREIIEISGRLELNLPLIKERHRDDAEQYVKCAYHDNNCWNCQKTLKDDYATYIALSLGEIENQRSDAEKLIGNTNNQEILFVFDSGLPHINNSPLKNSPLAHLFGAPLGADKTNPTTPLQK